MTRSGPLTGWLSAGQISAAAAPGREARWPSASSSALPSLHAQTVHLQRASLQRVSRAGLTPQLSGFNKGCFRGLGLDAGGGKESLPKAGGTRVSETSLAPSGWTSGARTKEVQHRSCQRRGLFPGHRGNAPPSEAAYRVCSPRSLQGLPPMGSASGLHMKSGTWARGRVHITLCALSLRWHQPPDLGTAPCGEKSSSPSCRKTARRRSREHLLSACSMSVTLKIT